MKIVLATGTSSLLILIGCVVFMQSFEDLSYSQSAGLGFLVLSVLFLSWLLSFFSIIEWVKNIIAKRFETRGQHLSVLPSLPMLCFSVLVLIFLIYRG